ncbi:MarR family transcriptional regulator [Naasia lichenicola]|uniref:MarR family transcriptional regulator n=1 Tax=Naasia lichenicola TaxID=2565933 RepID=UPI00130E49C5|nr:MarR family transcriptional regulator [Naasia lichenicola]
MQDATSTLEWRLAYVVGRANRRLQGATGGLSHGLLSALATVANRGPIRPADLAAAELVSAPSITRVIADLEARGLVERSSDPIDGRAYLIQVSEEGTAAVQRAREARAIAMADLLAELDAAERAAITAALPALERAIRAG